MHALGLQSSHFTTDKDTGSRAVIAIEVAVELVNQDCGTSRSFEMCLEGVLRLGLYLHHKELVGLFRTTAEEGGETVFPLAAHKVTGPQWSECARGGAAVKATRGDALLFYRC